MTGPIALVRHPLCTTGALRVLPWSGILLNKRVAGVIGIALYTGPAPVERAELAAELGANWEACRRRRRVLWL